MAKKPANLEKRKNIVVIILLSFVVGLPVISQPLGFLNSQPAAAETTETGSTATVPTGSAYAGYYDEYFEELFNRGLDENTSPDGLSDPTGQPDDSCPTDVLEVAPDNGDLTVPEPSQEIPMLAFDFEAADCTFYISSNTLNVRSRPSTDSPSLGTLKFGEKIQVTGTSASWTRVIYNDQIAYIYTKYTSSSMVFETVSQTVYVTASSVNFRKGPATDAESITKLSKNTRLTRTGIGDGWSRVKTSNGTVGYVSSEFLTTKAPYVAPTTDSSGTTYTGDIGKLVDYAYSALGVHYVHAGSSMNGFDCSGFVSWAYRQIGIYVPRSTSGYYDIGIKVSYSNLKAGDIICMDTRSYDGKTSITHVGLYVGNGKMIHASSTNNAVVITSLSHYLNYCKLITIRRMINN